MAYPGGPIPRLQPVYHVPAHRDRRTGQSYSEHWTVGLNWRTGQGQYPVANGVFHALGHMKGPYAFMRVWGYPSEPYPGEETDEEGHTGRSYKIRTLDLARLLVGDPALHVRHLTSGRYLGPDTGPDPALARAISDFVQDGWDEIHVVTFSQEPW